MLSSDLIDVIIGVVFAWFLLSLVVSAVNESVAWATKARAKLLWRALGQMFSAGVDAADARLRTLVVELPRGTDDMRPMATTEPSALSSRVKDPAPDVTMAAAMSGEADDPERAERAELLGERLSGLYEYIRRRVPDPAPGNRRTRISHVPASVVCDAVETLAARTVTRASLQAAAADQPALLAAFENLPDGALEAETFLEHVPATRREEAAQVWDRARRFVTFEDIESIVRDNPALLARLRAAVAGMRDDERVVKAREEIERWFDGSMDALSRFYRRQNRKVVALIALPIVLLANADAFDLVHRLREDQDLRAASTTAASQWAAEPLFEASEGIDLEEVCARVTAQDEGATPAAEEPPPPGTGPAADAVQEARQRYRCATELFASSDLIGPIGPRALWREIRAADEGGVAADFAVWSYEGLIGRVVTWIALLFGASFWYDALRRLIGLRGKVAGAAGGASG
ncbi:MAG TPA: hypothetical protein VG478_04940 [Acidimicrobiales bacterium]|jgi:hypothetical protein|nr:hypothetical protein [Acidimicrobiales bacterium]